MINRALFSTGLAACVMLSLGCRQERPVAFEPNLVHAHRYVVSEDLPMEQVVRDLEWALERTFGNPNEPRLPALPEGEEALAELVSMDRLQRSAGPIPEDGSDGRGLYRRHCATCHGISGNGRGPTVAVLDPYPRDFRSGVFKFKSTTRGAKPTRQDLFDVIRHGIGGTPMNPIPELTEEDIWALVDYVIYLSWRGEVERMNIDLAAMQLDLAAGDRLVRPDLAHLEEVDGETLQLTEEEEEQLDAFVERVEEVADEMGDQLSEEDLDNLDSVEVQRRVAQQSGDEQLRTQAQELAAVLDKKHKLDQKELWDETWEYFQDSIVDVGNSWLEAEDEVTDIEEPGEIPVPRDHAEFAAMMSGPQADTLRASVDRGRELFVSESVGCAKCHGNEGRGDGQTNDYDDWTKEWTSQIGLDPQDDEALVPLMARGALPPRNIRPRNFAEGVFRGGGAPEELFRRIDNGIAGTPMPAATYIDGVFERQDVWHLINYIRSLQEADEAAEAPEHPVIPEGAEIAVDPEQA